MLSISTPRKGADGSARYYTDDKAEYYLEGQGQLSHWFGHGAQALGLAGPVERAPFYHLLNGYSPDGHQPRVQNAGHPDRQCCWDLTFSAPKSVSVLWALAPDDARHEIEQAHQRAVEQALEYVEEKAGLTRRGHGGKILEKAELVFATFQEGASRALDPQLHTHAVLINLGLRQDGTTGSLKTEDLFATKMKAGALYQARLADQLRDRLGLTLQRERVGFSVVGVPKELCRTFSKRRQKIEKVLQERGVNHAVAAKIATLDTRPAKEPVAAAKLFHEWREVAQAQGWSTDQAWDLLGHARTQGAQSQPLRTHDELTGTQPTAREHSAADSAQPHATRRAGERGTKPEAPWPAHSQNHSGEISGTRAKPGEVNEPNCHRTEAGHRADRERLAGREVPAATRATSDPQREGEPEHSATASAETRADRQDGARGAKQAAPSSEPSQGDRGANSDTRKAPGNPQPQDPHQTEGGRRVGQTEKVTSQPASGPQHEPGRAQSATRKDSPEAERATKEEASSAGHSQQTRADSNGTSTEPGAAHEASQSGAESESRAGRQRTTGKARATQGSRAAGDAQHSKTSAATGVRTSLNRFVHLEWRYLFPDAPRWSPVKRWQAPALILGSPNADPPRWGRVLWRQNLFVTELRLQQRRVFPHAACWNPLKDCYAPALVLGRPTSRRAKWGKILWAKDVRFAELRLQKRSLFRRAPKWSPLHGLAVPALRLTAKQASVEPRVRVQPAAKPKSKAQSQSDGHSHSQ
jgi:conjugative relaxase-like TrwC/TraI family protein